MLPNTIYNMGAIEGLRFLDEESVDMCITSPPYWGLRDYGVDGQIGLEPHPQMYIDHLVDVSREIKHVLKKSGSFYLNLGDTYCSTAPGTKNTSPSRENRPYGQHGLNYRPDVKYDGKWLQPKQLMLIPSRVAIALQDDGWVLRNDIIWHKPNPMPSSVKDRLNTTYEHIFHFVKNRKYYYDLNAIRIPHKEGVTRWGGNKMRVPLEQKRQQGLAKSLLDKERPWRSQNGKNPGDVMKIATKPFKGAHFAVFPEKLIEIPIKAGCPEYICKKCEKVRKKLWRKPDMSKRPIRSNDSKYTGRIAGQKYQKWKNSNPDEFIGWSDCGCNAGFRPGIVLDPFIGSGTTAVVCKKLGLNYIGFEINKEYCEIAKKRIKES